MLFIAASAAGLAVVRVAPANYSSCSDRYNSNISIRLFYKAYSFLSPFLLFYSLLIFILIFYKEGKISILKNLAMPGVTSVATLSMLLFINLLISIYTALEYDDNIFIPNLYIFNYLIGLILIALWFVLIILKRWKRSLVWYNIAGIIITIYFIFLFLLWYTIGKSF